jgi:OOP family OmpA-OmpF porin
MGIFNPPRDLDGAFFTLMEDCNLYKKARNFFVIGCASLFLLTLASTGQAADGSGFYADAHGGTGIFWNETARVAPSNVPSSINAHTNYDVGWLAGASAGYAWTQGFATEFEFTFRQNHINRIATSGPLFLGGDMHSYAMMLNGYYRFRNSTPFTPYIGGGLGEAVVVMNNTRPAGGIDRGPFGGTDATFGYQGIAGVSYPIAERVSLAAEYRYFATLRPSFEQNIAGNDTKISQDYSSNNVLLRVVYSF